MQRSQPVTLCDLLVLHCQYSQHQTHQTEAWRPCWQAPSLSSLAAADRAQSSHPHLGCSIALSQISLTRELSGVADVWIWAAGQPNGAWSCAGSCPTSSGHGYGRLCLAFVCTVPVRWTLCCYTGCKPLWAFLLKRLFPICLLLQPFSVASGHPRACPSPSLRPGAPLSSTPHGH